MVERNKVKVVKGHCKRLDEQIQEIHQELLESATINKTRWLEHNRKYDEISSKIEILTNQIQSF
jgi:chemotaxis methyl-accepting protein methylase